MNTSHTQTKRSPGLRFVKGSALARLVVAAFVVSLVLVGSEQRASAGGPVGYDLTSGNVEQVKAHLRATGFSNVADHMITRVTRGDPARAGIHWSTILNTTSPNWAGYVADMTATLNTVNEVRGYFIAKPESSLPAVGSWTGIGGWNGRNLWQSGIDQYYMQAWVEIAPIPAMYTFLVNAGDQMFSNVYENPDNTWDLLIDDVTTGQYTLTGVPCCPDQTTAEWIVESQGNPIGSFDPVPFSYAGYFYNHGAFEQGIDSNAAYIGWDVQLVNGAYCITPSALGSDHRSFSAHWGCQ